MRPSIFLKMAGLFLLLNLKVQAQADLSEDWVNAPELELVRGHCTGCHSSQLILSQRLSRRDWLLTIRLMQAQHGLWPLGDFEEPILSYLATHYGPDETAYARRKPLKH